MSQYLEQIARSLKQLTSTGTQQIVVSGSSLNDSNGNEAIKTVATTSAVNEVSVTNAAASGTPLIASTGDSDSNIALNLGTKGTAPVNVVDAFTQLRTATTITTAGAATYGYTQIAGGLILRDPNGANRTDAISHASGLVSAFKGCVVGTSIIFYVRNTADAAETITVEGGVGVTLSGTMTIAQNQTRTFLLVFDNVTSSSEAVTVYSLGVATH